MNWTRNKYKAVKTTIDGITFDSKREAKRYTELKLLEKSGMINLELQPQYDIIINGAKNMQLQGRLFLLHRSRGREGTYRNSKGEWIVPTKTGQKEGQIVEDVKGFKTPIYRLEKKLVEACYPWYADQEV